jgi:hypothetical protein
MRNLLLLVALAPLAASQTVCQPTPAWTPCEIVFELDPQEAAAHPNPYLTVRLEGEFRSPRFRTFRMPAYWDGGSRFVIRFTPVDPGQWTFRLSSNLKRFDDQQGTFAATDPQSKGFLRPANVHHWARVDDVVRTPHLWMGDAIPALPYVDRAAFDSALEARAAQKFTHLRGVLLPPPGKDGAFRFTDRPDPALFRELDARLLALNGKGLIADLTLAYNAAQLKARFPGFDDRERFVQYVVARYSGLDITWQLLDRYEDDLEGRVMLRELGGLLKKLDPYQHPRSTGADGSSSPLTGDGWMNFISSRAAAPDVGAIEHQLFPGAQIDLGAPAGASADAVRRRIWNAAMNGQYPAFTGDLDGPDAPAARQMAVWFDFFSRTRHWELEPYFDVDGGRCVALEGIEYVVYVENPGLVELVIEKHGYDVAWFNPLTGEYLREKKEFKGDKFSAEPPDKTHDWVLHLSREGKKEGMLRSVKFDSRETPIGMQEVEQDPRKAPFDIAEPAADTVSLARPARFAIRLTRENRATRRMMYLWTGEVAADQQGARVIATGAEGTFAISPTIAGSFPTPMAVRLYGMNANGKVYSLIKVYTLTK